MRISDWSSDVCSSDLEYPERTADMSIEDDALTARLAMKPLGPIRQLGFVVRDLNQAIRAWTDIGVGPFYVAESPEISDQLYFGKPTASRVRGADRKSTRLNSSH